MGIAAASALVLTTIQWLPGLVWIAALLLGLIVAIPLLRARTRQGEVYLGGHTADEAAGAMEAVGAASDRSNLSVEALDGAVD